MNKALSDEKLSKIVELYFKGFSVEQAIERVDREESNNEQSDIDRQTYEGS